MSKRAKFLYRPNEYGSWFASLGRKLKAIKRDGVTDWGVKERYEGQRERLKRQNVDIRHLKWLEVYDLAYRDAFDQAVDQLKMSDKQAFKFARKKAEYAVIDAFPDEITTTRAVRDAIFELEYHGD